MPDVFAGPAAIHLEAEVNVLLWHISAVSDAGCVQAPCTGCMHVLLARVSQACMCQADLVFSQMGVQADAGVLPCQVSSIGHEGVGDRDWGSGSQANAQH